MRADLLVEDLADAIELGGPIHPEQPGHTWVSGHPYITKAFDLPSRRLDYVFVPHGAQIRRAEVVLDKPDPVYPSDHFGVLVDLTWP